MPEGRELNVSLYTSQVENLLADEGELDVSQYTLQVEKLSDTLKQISSTKILDSIMSIQQDSLSIDITEKTWLEAENFTNILNTTTLQIEDLLESIKPFIQENPELLEVQSQPLSSDNSILQGNNLIEVLNEIKSQIENSSKSFSLSLELLSTLNNLTSQINKFLPVFDDFTSQNQKFLMFIDSLETGDEVNTAEPLPYEPLQVDLAGEDSPINE